jgi:hypothetical protein
MGTMGTTWDSLGDDCTIIVTGVLQDVSSSFKIHREGMRGFEGFDVSIDSLYDAFCISR